MQDIKDIKKFIKKRINKNRVKRPCRRYTDLELLESLKRVGNNQRISETEYLKAKSETDPSTTIFHKRFGSFNSAVEMLYGLGEPKMPFEIDEIYMVKLMIEYGIKTKEAYLRKHEADPELFPSEYHVFKLFKNYGNLFEAAKRFSISEQVMRCLELKHNFGGKTPSWEDYSKHGINTALLKKAFVKISILHRKIRLLEEAYEARNRDQSETGENAGSSIEKHEKEMFEPFSRQLRK